jgi:energy-coupling factor transporter ATP-binding protein EcfA2
MQFVEEMLKQAKNGNNSNKTQSGPIDIAEINNVFKMPIQYNDKTRKLNENIIADLELVKTIEQGEGTKETPIYNHIFKSSNILGKTVLEAVPKYYTTDTAFLKDTQQLIKQFKSEDINTISNKHGFTDVNVEETVANWREIKGETGFHSKYLYVDWSFGKFINNNPKFLQLMSMYNITSPLLSLLLPIFVLIVPFFIIKVKGIKLSMNEYIEVLKALISQHSIVKVFTNFTQADMGQKAYLLASAAFYLFSIYQNILVCIRFYSNMKKIHEYINNFKNYLDYTITMMNYHLSFSNELTNYMNFNADIKEKIGILTKFKNEMDCITPLKFSLAKAVQIGHIMYTFYQLYENEEYHEAMLYSFGFNGYMNNICGLKQNIDSGKMNATNYTVPQDKDNNNKEKKSKKGKPVFKNMYYPKFIDDENVVKNDCDLNKNMIITGPNASGKTTTLKTVLINVILSQQTGFGCFDKLKMTPFDNIHSYLNIPDTSGRDSLFQAEARRCKEILDCIEDRGDETHIASFDELYSGTNPEEAVSSANAFMEFIIKNDNVTCLLTTHYTKLCKKLAKNKKIENYNMKTVKKNDNFEYTYLIDKGISNVKGGIKVLSDMNYPKEILDKSI